MKKDRFRVIHRTSKRINKTLSLLDFRKLEGATDQNSKNKFTFIDLKRREFWIVDQNSLNQSVEFVKDLYNQETIKLELQQ